MPTLQVSRLLWKTRGRHWDYEFISVPEVPPLPGWMNTLDEILGSADAHAEQLLFGDLVVGNGGSADVSHAFAAIRFLDPERTDWTGRRVQHFGVWFLGAPVQEIPELVPIDWHRQALEALAQTFGGEEVFGMTEAAIRSWRQQHDESRAAYVLRRVRQTPAAVIDGPIDAGRWRRVGTLKKKSTPRPETTSGINPTVVRSALIGLTILVVGVLLLRLTCG